MAMETIYGHAVGRMIPASIPKDEGPLRRRCPVCGTKFSAGRAWTYRTGTTYFCRYNCMRAWQRAHPQRREKHGISPASQWSVRMDGGWRESADGCRARLSYCRDELAKRRQSLANALTFGSKQREAISRRVIRIWEDNIREAEEMLRTYDGRADG